MRICENCGANLWSLDDRCDCEDKDEDLQKQKAKEESTMRICENCGKPLASLEDRCDCADERSLAALTTICEYSTKYLVELIGTQGLKVLDARIMKDIINNRRENYPWKPQKDAQAI